jgi:GTPase
MKWRLQEGFGEAIYEIGVEDNGSCCGLSEDDLEKSLETLKLYVLEIYIYIFCC